MMIAYVAGPDGSRANDDKSNGRIALNGEWEYFDAEGNVYRANTSNPIGVNGYRQGARYECTAAQFPTLRKLVGF